MTAAREPATLLRVMTNMCGFTVLIAWILSSTASADNPGTSSPTIEHYGQYLARAPAHISPLLIDPAPPSVDAIRLHLEAHDLDAALWEAERLSETARWGRDRDLAWMVRGIVHRERREHNLASAAFTKVRAGNGPLAEFGTYYEAEQDLARGRYWVAAKECDRYRKKYDNGRFDDQCHRLQAIAYARANAWKTARKTAGKYDEDHPSAPITEQIELTLTLGAMRDQPEQMIPRLQDHATSFRAALTGTIAVEKLAELRAQGFENAVLPDDPRSRMLRAYSLRYTKQTAAAWKVFERLAVESDDDPETRKWVEREAIPFGWRTRNWDFLEEFYTSLLQKQDRPDYAWSKFKVLVRGGRYAEATDSAEVSLKTHARSKVWRKQHEEVAKAYLLEGHYEGARRHYLLMAKQGGWTGLRGTYYAAFSSYMLGDDDDAAKRLNALVAANGAYADAALYWRARLNDRRGDTEAANADLERLAADHASNWYGVLATATLQKERAHLDRRSGEWSGDPAPQPPEFLGTAPPSFLLPMPLATPQSASVRPSATGFATMLWGTHSTPEARAPARPLLWVDLNQPPNIGLPTWLFDRKDATRTVGTWAQRHKGAWSELRTAYDLARAGLYDLSGPLFSAVYEEWRAAYKSGHHKKHAAARRMKLKPDEWRKVFNFMADHHHAARFNHSAWKVHEDPDLRLQARRVGYPLAHGRYVWEHSRANNIDPYLVLGLMRQESTYNSIARSPVGARGAMQIMPRTGHLLANLKHDTNFTAGNLEDPIFAVGYGIDYLGMLMDRFGGAYPLAIASYNGGPFNVSTWVSGTGRNMPMDEVVEHIPYRETRDYVKKVSAGYATYLSLYAPEGTLLDPHLKITADKANVVDF